MTSLNDDDNGRENGGCNYDDGRGIDCNPRRPPNIHRQNEDDGRVDVGQDDNGGQRRARNTDRHSDDEESEEGLTHEEHDDGGKRNRARKSNQHNDDDDHDDDGLGYAGK